MKLLHRVIKYNPRDDQNTFIALFTHKSPRQMFETKLKFEITVNDHDEVNTIDTGEVFMFTRVNGWVQIGEIDQIITAYKLTDEDTEGSDAQVYSDFTDDTLRLAELAQLILDPQMEHDEENAETANA